MYFLYQFGKYLIFLRRVFAKPDKYSMYYKQIIREMEKLGVHSISIIALVSLFMGAVICIQTAFNTPSMIFPKFLVALTARDSIILEFSSTMVALILAGKVGSNIASELGTMRVTDQIDALETMGVNSASYLVLPKIIAMLIFNPFLTMISSIVGIFGGWIAGILTGAVTSQEYIYGLQYSFTPYFFTYSIIKTVIFAFIITSVSAFQGYYVSGGSLDVGRSSTKAVVFSSVLVLFFNVLLTQVLLT